MINTDMFLPFFKTYCNSEFPSDPKINITKIGALAKLMSGIKHSSKVATRSYLNKRFYILVLDRSSEISFIHNPQYPSTRA